MKKLLDLRFVIGSFFTIIGILLLVYSFSVHQANTQNVNLWCGGIFIIFGIIMILLSYRKQTDN